MPRAPRLIDIAQECKVSVATVSKALNPHLDRCDLHADTRARIVATAQGMGWTRDRPRSARARRRWHNIGVLWGYRDFSISSYEGVPEALARAVDSSFRLLLTPVPQASDWRELQLSLHLDGVVVLGHVEDAILAELERDEYPAVLVNEETPRRLRQVLTDDLGGAGAVVRHLAGFGHRRLVFVRNAWPVAHYSERDRLRAVRETAAEAGIRVHEVRGLLYETVVEHCRAGATAVLCNSHWEVGGLLAALRAAGLKVPARVSVAACHDLASFAHFQPPVTAVAVPLRDMATAAATLLMDLIAGRDPGLPQRCVLPEQVVVRASTARARENPARKHPPGRRVGHDP